MVDLAPDVLQTSPHQRSFARFFPTMADDCAANGADVIHTK